MLMIDSPNLQISGQVDYSSHNDELNRVLCAAVVSKSFRNMLLTNPEIAVTSGYHGEKFNLSDADRTWLFSLRPSSLVDLAAGMVNYQQNVNHECPVKLPVDQTPHYVRVN